MFDGTIWIFGDVKHVSDLKSNLFSLSTLNSKRINFSMKVELRKFLGENLSPF